MKSKVLFLQIIVILSHWIMLSIQKIKISKQWLILGDSLASLHHVKVEKQHFL